MALQPAVVSSPSPFSALLRRSKFASYDTRINQVYTTYGGHAHRGNWGLKRPLPLRRRKAYITVNAIDRYQQTEWNNAEAQARFVRKWDELDVDVRSRQESSWDRKLMASGRMDWFVDSEFAPRSYNHRKTSTAARQPHPKGPRTHAVPNIHAMSEVEFQGYLKRLRKLRPKFKRYMKEVGNQRLRVKSLYELAQAPSNYHTNFIAAHAALPLHSLDSRFIEEIPHRSAGLTYTHVSPLQTAFTSRAFPGIILHPNESKDRAFSPSSYAVSFAGMVATLPLSDTGSGEKHLMDLKSDHGIRYDAINQSRIKLRLTKVPLLSKVPNVVGRNKEGLKAADISLTVASDEQLDWKKSNPRRPGSMEYVSMEDSALPVRMRAKPMSSGQRPFYTPRPFPEAMKVGELDNNAFLDDLAKMVREQKNDVQKNDVPSEDE
jgi:hypothetical protein